MIVQLSCSTSWSRNNVSTISFTGERVIAIKDTDSVKVAYSDLRVVNGKLVELKYTKEINSKLKSIIYNDSIIIDKHKVLLETKDKQSKTYRNQRNIAIGSSMGLFLLLILSLIK